MRPALQMMLHENTFVHDTSCCTISICVFGLKLAPERNASIPKYESNRYKLLREEKKLPSSKMSPTKPGATYHTPMPSSPLTNALRLSFRSSCSPSRKPGTGRTHARKRRTPTRRSPRRELCSTLARSYLRVVYAGSSKATATYGSSVFPIATRCRSAAS